MTSNSRLCKIKDFVDLISEKISTAGLSVEDYISTENMLSDLGGVQAADRLPDVPRVNKYETGDTLFSNIRTYFRKVWLANKDGGVSADVLVFRTKDKSVLLPEFLYYVLSNMDFINYTVRTSKGVKMPRGDKAMIMEYEFELPELPVQAQICKILSSLDKQVFNNTAMNQTLEKIAQRIFKSWFIDFDPVKANAEGVPFNGLSPEIQALFPSEFEESELRMIPKGWKRKTLSELGEIVTGKTPSTDVAEFYGSDIPFITIPDMHGKVFVTKSSKMLSYKGRDSQSKKTLKKGAIAVSCIATPGLTVLIHEDSQTNQQINTLTPKSCPSLFTYMTLSSMSKGSAFTNTGTVFSNMNKSSFSALKMLIATKDIMNKFDEILSPIFDKILINQKESDNLAKIRDRLLPRLITGKFLLSESNQELKETV